MAPIVNFHSTFVMNMITYFGVVVLYRDLTNKRVGWCNVDGPIQPRDLRWLRKYRDRGYTVRRGGESHGTGGYVCDAACECPNRIRSLFDHMTGVVRFRDYRVERTYILLKELHRLFVWQLHKDGMGLVYGGGRGFVMAGGESLVL
jgi:hypothetical protein